MVLLFSVGRWYVATGAARARARVRKAREAVELPQGLVQRGMIVLILLMVAKFVYNVSFSSYYTFYLIERFGLVAAAQEPVAAKEDIGHLGLAQGADFTVGTHGDYHLGSGNREGQ